MNLKNIKSIHFVGIKGVAMTALAIVAQQMGMKVTGSDVSEEFPTDETLLRAGISYSTEFKAEHIQADIDLVIFTGAHQGSNNPEVIAAVRFGIPAMAHGKALPLFIGNKRLISVAGSHGKTTTSAMIASILTTSGFKPSYAIGCGAITNLNTSGHLGEGNWWIVEADEYVTDPQIDQTPRFLWQHPQIVVITNIDYDHPDVYPNLAAVQQAFVDFTGKMTADGVVIANSDDLPTVEILPQIKRKVITFGNTPKADYQLLATQFSPGANVISIKHEKKIHEFTLRVPGQHNAYNAAAACAVFDQLGLTNDQITHGFGEFTGTKRRFEQIQQVNNKVLIDDYAHHPTEIAATISAARQWYPNYRLLVVFQPHTFSRTQALLPQFAEVLARADVPIITDIYASSRESSLSGISGELLFSHVKKLNKSAIFAPDQDHVLKYLGTQTQQNDLIVTMGAGNIYTWLHSISKIL